MSAPLLVQGDTVTGEVAVSIAPGTVAAACDRAITAALNDALSDAAAKLGVVLAAPANKFARPLPGKDADGRTVYAVRGRAEGGRLVPDHAERATKKGRR